MFSRIMKGLIGPSPASKAGSDPRRSSLPSRADRIALLAAVSQGAGECPVWILMELEAGEKAERELTHAEDRRGS